MEAAKAAYGLHKLGVGGREGNRCFFVGAKLGAACSWRGEPDWPELAFRIL